MSTDFSQIESPRLWRLSLLLDDGCLRVAAGSSVADSTLILLNISLDASLPRAKALEEAVYSTPALLADFGKIDILLHTSDYTLIPLGADADAAAGAAMIAHPDIETEILTDSTKEAEIVWAADADTIRFLRRTFPCASIHTHLWPLTAYLTAKNDSGNCSKVHAHLTADSIDILVFADSGKLLALTTKPVSCAADAAYYILATAGITGIDAGSDRIFLCGDSSMRADTMTLLRQYVRHVAPLIFPSAALRAGRQAFAAPFPLILLPLCE